MYTVFTDDTINTLKLPAKSSLINFSLYKELHCPMLFRSFSIKYVGEGCEMYTVNGNKYEVCGGQYLLANHFSEGFIEIDSKSAVKGICIDVAPDLLSDVVASYRRPDAPIADRTLDNFFNTSDFYENKYHAQNTHVGQFLKKIDHEISVNSFQKYQFSDEFFFILAEKIVADHIEVFKQLQNIPSVKYSTRKDLHRRLSKARLIMEDDFGSGLDIKSIAMECGLSEYHFFRLFKSAYGISPHQYLIQMRLIFASNLLKNKNYSVTAAAFSSGFADVYSFSKSFKKYFGFAPSTVIAE